MIGEIPVLGTTEDESYWGLIGKSCAVFVALENPTERKKMIELIEEDRKTKPVHAIHPSVQIANVKSLAYGIFIGANSVIGAETKISDHVVIGPSCIIETGAVVDEYSQIGAGSVVGKEAQIEKNAFIGIHSTIVGSIKIGKGATIGAGSVVIENIPASKRAFGNPAKIL
jgi:sugar O-acyltransferase (sialic acid O-acetyltransferase NeuD family)